MIRGLGGMRFRFGSLMRGCLGSFLVGSMPFILPVTVVGIMSAVSLVRSVAVFFVKRFGFFRGMPFAAGEKGRPGDRKKNDEKSWQGHDRGD